MPSCFVQFDYNILILLLSLTYLPSGRKKRIEKSFMKSNIKKYKNIVLQRIHYKNVFKLMLLKSWTFVVEEWRCFFPLWNRMIIFPKYFYYLLENNLNPFPCLSFFILQKWRLPHTHCSPTIYLGLDSTWYIYVLVFFIYTNYLLIGDKVVWHALL